MLAFPMEAEYGLTEAWQVELEWRTYSRVRRGDVISSGRGAVSVGTKYSFMHIKGSAIHAAVGLEADFPGGLGADGAREDKRRGRTLRRAGRRFARTASRHSSTSASHSSSAGLATRTAMFGESSASVQWNAGALMALRRTTLALEFNTHTDGSPWRPGGELYATPSITFLLPRPWEVGFGVPIGLGGHSDRFGLAVHVIYEK